MVEIAQRVAKAVSEVHPQPTPLFLWACALGATRTRDPLLRKQML